MQIKFNLQLPEKISLNEVFGGHWRKRHKVKEMYEKSIRAQVQEQITGDQKLKIDSYEDFPIEVAYLFKWRIRPLDASNTPVKLVEDSLVKAGIFPDDSPKYVSGITIYSEKGERGQKGDWVEVIFTL